MSTELEELRAENERLRAQVTELQTAGTTQLLALRQADRPRMVREFFVVANQERPLHVITPADHVVRFRLDLVAEEVFEMLYSAFAEEHGPEIKYLEKQVRAAIARLYVDVDVPAFADAAIDIDYVVEGGLVAFGVDSRPLWAEVHRKNMEKQGGPRTPDGKLLKPPGWTPPDIAGLLRAQGWVG